MTAPAESTSPWRYFCEPGNAWTRNPTPAAWTGTEPGLVRLLEMTRPELRMYSAVHEAGHAVTAALHTDRLTPGAPSIGLHGVHITHPEWNGRLLRTPGQAHISWDTGTSFFDLALWAAAGERATDRWLREEDLWTPARGWVTEVTALGDRDFLNSLSPRLRIAYTDPERRQCHSDGVTPVDLAAAHTNTDQMLEEVWPAVRHVARLLYAHSRLTGAQVHAVASQYVPLG